MSIKIPIKLNRGKALASAPAGNGARLSLPINFSGVGSRLFSGNRQVPTLRAVAAAVSLHKPAEALRKVKEAEDSPDKVIAPGLDEEKLSKVIQAVKEVQDDPKIGQTPTAEQIAAARAIGANPVLVRAAYDSMKDEAAVTNGMGWVAAVDVGLLAQAARAGARRTMLEKVPEKQGIGSITNRMNTLEKKVKDLEKQCNPANLNPPSKAKPKAKPKAQPKTQPENNSETPPEDKSNTGKGAGHDG